MADTQTHWDTLGGEHVRKIVPGLLPADDAKMKGLSAQDNYRMLVTNYGATFTEDEWYSHIHDLGLSIYQEHGTLTHGLPELLDRMAIFPQLPKPSIASASVREWIEGFLVRFVVRESFGFITTGIEVTHGKPAPDIYLKAAEKLGIPPEECIAIEDSDPGVAAAKGAGMYCIGLHSSVHITQQLVLADTHIDSFDDLTADVLASLLR